jgi:hypothetical protein
MVIFLFLRLASSFYSEYFLRMKLREREADHSHRSSARISTYTPHDSAQRRSASLATSQLQNVWQPNNCKYPGYTCMYQPLNELNSVFCSRSHSRSFSYVSHNKQRFLACFPYFGKNKYILMRLSCCLWVSVCVSPPNNFGTPEQMFTKLGMFLMSSEGIWTIYQWVPPNTAACRIIEVIALILLECLKLLSWNLITISYRLIHFNRIILESVPSVIPTLQLLKFYCFIDLITHTLSRGSVVGIVTGYGEVAVRVPVGLTIFSSPNRPDWLWGPPNLLSNFPGVKAAGAWSWPLTSS